MSFLVDPRRPAGGAAASGRTAGGSARKFALAVLLRRLSGVNGRDSVPAFIDEAVLGDPRHHRAQLLADLLDSVFGGPAPERLEAGLAGGVLEHPFAGEAARLDIFEDPLHLGADMGVDDPGTARVVAVFGGVRYRITHIGDAAFIDQIDDQLDLVQALEIGHLRRIAGLHQGFVAGQDQRAEPAAQYRLLAEQIGLALFAKRRLDDPGAPAADRRGVREGELERVPRRVLRHRDQTGHAAAALIFGAHDMARALRRDHEN